MGAGSECRYSGASMGISCISGFLGVSGVHWGLTGNVGTEGPVGV